MSEDAASATPEKTADENAVDRPESSSPPIATHYTTKKARKKKKKAAIVLQNDPQLDRQSSTDAAAALPSKDNDCESSIARQVSLGDGDTSGRKDSPDGVSGSRAIERSRQGASLTAATDVKARGESVAFAVASVLTPISSGPSMPSSVVSPGAPINAVEEDLPDETGIEAEADETVQTVELPALDPSLVDDLEQQALLVADNLNHLLGNMSTNLHAMSGLTLRGTDAYRESVEGVGVAVDENIKSMYSLIAKCEGISQNMKPIYMLADQIKGVKKTLTTLEQMCK